MFLFSSRYLSLCFSLLTLFATSCFFASCASTGAFSDSSRFGDIRVTKSPGFSQAGVSQLVFLPLDGAIARNLSLAEISNLEGLLMREFSLKTNFEVLNLSEKELVEAKLLELGAGPVELRAKMLTELFPGSGAVVWKLTEYQSGKKNQSTEGRESKVGFKLTVYAAGGNEFWSAHFQRSEQSLSENIFRFKEAVDRGVRFETEESLLRKGFARVASDFSLSSVQ